MLGTADAHKALPKTAVAVAGIAPMTAREITEALIATKGATAFPKQVRNLQGPSRRASAIAMAIRSYPLARGCHRVGG
jgi:hypothetical protein